MPRTDAVWDWGDWTTPSGPCGQCEAVVSCTSAGELCPAILALLQRWASALMRPRVADAVGSPTSSVLERAVIIRHLVAGVAVRLGGMLHEGHPVLADWSVDGDGAGPPGDVPDPVQVAADIEDAGRAVAARLRAIAAAPAPRGAPGLGDVPDAVLVMARRLIHDLGHHLHEASAAAS